MSGASDSWKPICSSYPYIVREAKRMGVPSLIVMTQMGRGRSSQGEGVALSKN